MKKLIKYVAMALVVAMTFSTATVSAYAYTPTNLKRLSYTPSYYADSSKVPMLTYSELRKNFKVENPSYEDLDAYYDLVYTQLKGNVSTGNVLFVLKDVEKDGCLAKGRERYTVQSTMLPNLFKFSGAGVTRATVPVYDERQLCGTKYPIVAELDNNGDVTYRVSDNALFRGNTEIIQVEEKSWMPTGECNVHIKYKIYGSHVVPGYEVKLGTYVGTNYSNRKVVSMYETTPNVFSYDIRDDEKNYTYGEACFTVPLDKCAGKTMDITFNGVKVGTYKFDS